jgi:DNA-binding transcriptional regulator YiaG
MTLHASELRTCREALGVSQEQFARMLGVSAETYRTWDAGRRAASAATLAKARAIVNAGEHALVALESLAREFKVSDKTLRRAAADGRLQAQFKTKTYFGKPIALATRAAVREFLAHAFGRSPTVLGCRSPLATPPSDYASKIIRIRRRLHFTQAALATRVGAANKAVVYQWETGKRTPSPVFWARLQRVRSR